MNRNREEMNLVQYMDMHIISNGTLTFKVIRRDAQISFNTAWCRHFAFLLIHDNARLHTVRLEQNII